MYEGNPVDLRMEKIISADGIFDEATRQCRFLMKRQGSAGLKNMIRRKITFILS